MIIKFSNFLLSTALLLVASPQVFANATIPEPESLALLVIGATAMMISRRKSK